MEPHSAPAQVQAMIHAEEQKVRALEQFVRMSSQEYLEAFGQLKHFERRRCRPRPRWWRPTSVS
jgi:hypothetical protein